MQYKIFFQSSKKKKKERKKESIRFDLYFMRRVERPDRLYYFKSANTEEGRGEEGGTKKE